MVKLWGKMTTINQSNVTAESEQTSYQFLIGLMIFKCISIVFGVLGNIGVIVFNVFYEQGEITPRLDC